MAAITTPMEARLRLVYEVGIDHQGKAIHKTKTYGNVDPAASADQLLAAAETLASLQTEMLAHVERTEVAVVEDQG